MILRAVLVTALFTIFGLASEQGGTNLYRRDANATRYHLASCEFAKWEGYTMVEATPYELTSGALKACDVCRPTLSAEIIAAAERAKPAELARAAERAKAAELERAELERAAELAKAAESARAAERAKAAELERPVVLRRLISQVAAQPPSRWRGGQSGRSAMDDSPTFTYTLDSTAPVRAWLKVVTPTLVTRCREHEIEAYMAADTAAARSLRLRWDEEPAQTEAWDESTTNESLFSPRPIEFLEKLAKAQRLRIEFTPLNASPVVVTFNVRGFGKRLDVLATACHEQWARSR